MIRVSDLFEPVYGVNLEYNKMVPDEKGIPFVARGSLNNGIVGYVKKIKGLEPNPANTISVAGSGSILESFLQEKTYYSGRDLYYLNPKKPLTKKQMLFYCMILRSNKYRYSYGRQANRTLGDIKIPSLKELPKWVNGTDIPNEPEKKPYHSKDVNLKDRKWKPIKVTDLFDRIEKCKCSNATQFLEEGDDINYIGAKKSENGVMQRVAMVDGLVSEGNCIVFIGDGAGSVGYATYQEDDFIGSTTLTCGYSKYLNKFTGLFLVSVLDLERYRYSFGRKYGKEQVSKTSIKLPVTNNGSPDWQFMEYYIKSLPYSSNLADGKPKKKRSQTYEKPLKIKGTFDDAMKALVSDKKKGK